MSVLFMMPVWNAASELWMRRMLDGLEPHLSAVAVCNPPSGRWRGHVRLIDVGLPQGIFGKGLRHLGMYPDMSVGRIRRCVRGNEIQAVLVNYIPFALTYGGVLFDSGKRVFIHCHGYDTTWDMREYSLERKRVHSEDYEDQVRQIPSSVTFITPCCSVKKRLVGIGIEPNRIRVRKFGIPSDAVFRPRPARREGVTVLYLGRLADCKGPDLVIRAFEMACDRGLSGNLIVAGDGPLNVACQLIVDRSKWRDRVTLLGAVDAQTGEKLRRSADVFTAHSCRGPITNQEEAAGIAFLEAMGSGLPVVTGRSGGITEYIVDGDNGLFFEPGDVETHADLLLRLANDPAMRSEIGRRAWETVKTDYPLENDSVEFPKILGL